MRKIIRMLSVLMAFVLFAFTGCASVNNSPNPDKAPPLITSEAMTKSLEEFLGVTAEKPDGDIGNRTYTSKSEKAAASRLHTKYSDATKYANLTVMPLETTTFDVALDQNTTRQSQNVIVRYKPTNSTGKQIIIGARYGNSFGAEKELSEDIDTSGGKIATGVLDNATGVATVMAMIDHISTAAPNLSYDIVFAFFGCSYNVAGASKYFDSTMTPSERVNTMLMVNVQRLGGDNLYLYSEEVETDHNKYLMDAGKNIGVTLNKLPSSMPVAEQTYIEGIPYLHYGLIGEHAPFMQKKIPVANFFSGSFGGFNIADIERAGEPNMNSTSLDTYKNLKANRPKYAEQMSDTASVILNSALSDNFYAAMLDNISKVENKAYDYSAATKSVWVYVSVIVVLVLLTVLMILLVKHFEKKYPYIPPVKNLKIAVFGTEYETQTEQDIYVDIKKPKNPFDGY